MRYALAVLFVLAAMCAVIAYAIGQAGAASSMERGYYPVACGPKAVVLNIPIKQAAPETGQWIALATDQQSMFRFYLNERSGTWTLVSIRVDGTACIAAYGTAFVPLLKGDPV